CHPGCPVPSLFFDLRVDAKSNFAHHRQNPLIRDPLFGKRSRILWIMVETERQTERNAVLRRHQIFRLVNSMMSHQFFDSANVDLADVPHVETILLREPFQPLDGRMSINVTGVAFDADIERLKLPSQTKSQLRKVRRVGKGPAKSHPPSENATRPGNPAPC